jgi:hypothetical protein
VLALNVVALATLWWNSRRDRQDRQRQLFAEAFEACMLYREFPFIVRCRNADDLVAERARITSELSRLQVRLDSGKALLRVEAPRVGAAYEDLVRETRRVAGPKIRKAWDEPALTADADVHTEGIDFADLKPFDDRYLRKSGTTYPSGRAGSARGGTDRDVSRSSAGQMRDERPG